VKGEESLSQCVFVLVDVESLQIFTFNLLSNLSIEVKILTRRWIMVEWNEE